MRESEARSSSDNIVDAGLLQHRDYIKSTLQSLPAGLLRQLFQAMEDRRDARCAVPVKSASAADMSAAEMQREVMWRLGTLPPEDAEAIAALVRQFAERV